MSDFLYNIYKRTRNGLLHRIYTRRINRRLKNRNFTLFCNNCIGGRIYHSLGMEFTSPFINLLVGENADDFVKFLKNREHYLNSELVFIHDGVKKYPRAFLDDIKIGFVHYKTEDEAVAAWERRKKRIINGRIWVIIYAKQGISKQDYDELTALDYKNIAVIAEKDCIQDFATDVIPISDKCKNWFSRDKYGFQMYERYFDFVSFLNKNS